MDKEERRAYIKKLLQDYKPRKVYLSNLYSDIEDIKKELRESPAPSVPKYSLGASGTPEETSPEERYYFQKEKLEERLYSLQQEVSIWGPLIRRLERALDALTPADRAIIENKYIYTFSWGITARAAHASESYCRDRKNFLFDLLADMVFGPNEPPVPINLFSL